jgi:hypothetical protein
MSFRFMLFSTTDNFKAKKPYMKLTLLATACLALAACGHVAEPGIVTQPVNMVVPVSCVPDGVGLEPTYSLTKEAWVGVPGATPSVRNSNRMTLLWTVIFEMRKRLTVLEPVVVGCR